MQGKFDFPPVFSHVAHDPFDELADEMLRTGRISADGARRIRAAKPVELVDVVPTEGEPVPRFEHGGPARRLGRRVLDACESISDALPHAARFGTVLVGCVALVAGVGRLVYLTHRAMSPSSDGSLSERNLHDIEQTLAEVRLRSQRPLLRDTPDTVAHVAWEHVDHPADPWVPRGPLVPDAVVQPSRTLRTRTIPVADAGVAGMGGMVLCRGFVCTAYSPMWPDGGGYVEIIEAAY